MTCRRLCLLGGLIAAFAFASPAQAAVLHCGDTVTKSVTLSADVVCSIAEFEQGAGLTAGADGIVINLNGHSVRCAPCGGTGSVGVAWDGHRRVTLRSGTVRGFFNNVVVDGDDGRVVAVRALDGSYGVTLAGDRNQLLNSRQADSDVYGVSLAGTGNLISGNSAYHFQPDLERNFPVGVIVFDAQDTTIRNSNFVVGPDPSIYLIYNTTDTTITGNRFSPGPQYGGGSFRAEYDTGTLVSSNRFTNSSLYSYQSTDLTAVGNLQSGDTNGYLFNGGSGIVLTRNRAQRNADAGFALQGVTDALLDGNVGGSTRTSSGARDGNGIGFELYGITGTLRRNSANANRGAAFGGLVGDNDGDGIRVVEGHVDLLDNAAHRNAADGITTDIDDFYVEATGVLARNVSAHNDGYGIVAGPDMTDGGGNRAFGNLLGQCVGIACSS